MPTRARTPCRQSGCATLVESPGYCETHRRDVVARYSADSRRTHPVETALYHTARWLRGRRLHLQLYPLCVHCLAAGSLVGASQVDHIVPHKGDRALFFDTANWQSLCPSCHSRKTAREQVVGKDQTSDRDTDRTRGTLPTPLGKSGPMAVGASAQRSFLGRS